MVYMELWRHFWSQTFRFLRLNVYNIFFPPTTTTTTTSTTTATLNMNTTGGYKSCAWEVYAPEFLKRGLKSLFIKFIQGRLEEIIRMWFMKGYDSMVGLQDILFFGDVSTSASTSATSPSTSEDYESDGVDYDEDGSSSDSTIIAVQEPEELLNEDNDFGSSNDDMVNDMIDSTDE